MDISSKIQHILLASPKTTVLENFRTELAAKDSGNLNLPILVTVIFISEVII
jgi:hypothetical protein